MLIPEDDLQLDECKRQLQTIDQECKEKRNERSRLMESLLKDAVSLMNDELTSLEVSFKTFEHWSLTTDEFVERFRIWKENFSKLERNVQELTWLNLEEKDKLNYEHFAPLEKRALALDGQLLQLRNSSKKVTGLQKRLAALELWMTQIENELEQLQQDVNAMQRLSVIEEDLQTRKELLSKWGSGKDITDQAKQMVRIEQKIAELKREFGRKTIGKETAETIEQTISEADAILDEANEVLTESVNADKSNGTTSVRLALQELLERCDTIDKKLRSRRETADSSFIPRIDDLQRRLDNVTHALEEAIKRLSQEIEDEKSFAANYERVIEDCDRLEQSVRELDDSEEGIGRMFGHMAELASKVEELQARKHSSLIPHSTTAGSTAGSPKNRRRHVVVLVTRVTTVITVIEEEIRKSAPNQHRQREALQELHTQLVQLRNNWEEPDRRDYEISRLIDSAEALQTEFESLLQTEISPQNLKNWKASLIASQEGRAQLQNIQNEIDRLSPSQTPSAQLVKYKDKLNSLINTLSALENRIGQQIAKHEKNITNPAKSVESGQHDSIKKEEKKNEQHSEALQKIGVQIAELQASSGVSTEPQWTLLEQQLEQLPTDDVDAMRLRDQLSRARQNQQDHELLYANLKNELSALQRHTDDVDANIRPYLEEVHTSKSGKKKKTKPAEKSFDIDQQIIDIRRALDDLQNHAMPQLGDLQRKADLNNVILDAAAPLQDRLSRLIDEYQASLSQKETTRDRSKEIETQLHEVQDMLPGLQHVARTAETLPIETSVAETELEQTDVALQKLNDMLTRLDRLPTDGVQEGQLNELSKQKQQVNSAIERVRAWRDALIRQLEALRQWHDDQTKCQSDATQICRQAQQLCDRYSQGPQPLQVGMDDLKAAQNLQTAIWDQQKVLQAVMDRVCGQLPDPRKQAEEVERLKGEMNESSTNLKTLTNALEKAVQQEEELLQQQTFAIDRLNALSGEVMNMHSIEGNTPQQLQDLRAQTEPIQGIVQQLEHDAARSPSLVFHSEHLNALAVRAQLDNLVALLNEKQEDATARLMLAAQVTTIAENKTMLQDALKSAAAIEKDENATLESVNFALEILEKDGRPHLSVIEQTYSQLTSAPEADAVRAQALSDMTNLGENLKTLQLQLDDRYAGMRAFDEKCGALENLLTETEILTSADLQERSQLEKAQLALDSIQPLMAQIEVNAVELQPMRMPTQKVADFQARQARLGVKMQDARQKIESDERLQAAVRDAEDLLARIDDQLLPIESLLADASSSREDLVHVCQDRLPTADRLIEELHKRLDSEEEHASELHSISDRAAAARRQFVEADRTVQLRLREMDDEQRLIDHITQQLQDAETVLDNLSTSDLHPQPLEQAVQDRNLLAVLLEQLHSIDLPAIRNAKNRTLLQERVAKVGERVQRLHDDLNDEVDEQTKIMEKLRDSLTRLNLIGDEISALPTDELDRHIAQMNTIQERLEDLIPTARIVDSAIDRPAKYILRPPVDRPLVERIVELQSILRERHEAATQLVQLKTVTPAINSVNDVLDTMLGQLEQAPVESLESQQAILEDLENNQRRLEQTLSELPPGKEADALRERSQWNLSRLKDWLKRLADAVGDRLAALAAFNATRDHVTRQVADLYNQNTSDASNESDIEGRIQQLLKLRTTLANATSDQLDTNSLKEAEILQQKIDEAIEQFQTALSNAKRLREEAILQAQFAANVKQAHDQLERLILAAQQQLADAEAIPNAYATLADDLTQELSATRYFLESAPADDSAVSELRTRLTLGDQLQQQLAQRWQLWQQFVHERDSANSRLDAVHSKLNKLMTKSREPLVDVRNSVDQLKLYGDDVEQLRTSMHNLQNLSEQLDPLESAYADVRFFDVGVEQTQQQYDDLLSGIAAEVRDEEHIQNAFVQLQAEIESVEDTMQAHDDASALDHALNYILPPLEAQFALLSDMHDAAVRNRKFVDRDRINTIAGEKLHNIRSQIESQLVHIAEQEKREQLQKIGVQIAELQASSGVSTEPQWTLLEQQLEQLPTDDVDAMRLRDQLSRARQNQQDHELLYANLKNELSALQRHTDDVDANIRPYLEEVHTSKSGKKKKTKPAEKSFDIDQQIIDIRRALDDLQNHAMPQLGDLQRKADLNNVILDAAAPLQDRLSRLIDEYQASLSQKETTRDRSKEIETQLHEVQDMLPGLQHVARTAETLPIETSVAETELEQTDVALQKLNDMLTRLDRLPTDGVQEGQLNELSKQKQQVNSAIERVRAWRDALIRQLEALRQWHDDQTKCQSDATQICRQAQQLCDRYSQGPQPLQVGMDDLKAAQNLQTAIWDQQKVLQAVMDRVCGQLPDPRKQAEEVERLKGEMNESSTNLKTLTNALEKAVQQEEELLQQQTFAIDRLNALSGEVMNMHSIEGNTPQQLQDLRAQTEPIQGIVQQLEHDAARSPSLVFHSEHLNALAVRAQLDNLVALLNEKQEDATARLMLAAQVTTIAENKTMLQDALKSAAAIEKDENATLESVNFALEILEKDGRPHLSVIEQTYSQLTSAPEADAVRAQALSDMTNLGENLKTLQLQLDDRYAGMRAFDEKCGALENLLTETEILTSADLQERSQLEKAQLALDSIQPLMAQIEVNAVELQPMRMPTQKVADFQARQARLGVKMQDARQKIESDERLQAAVRDAEDLLARIDDQLLPIESLLADASSSREDLVHVCQDRLPTADRLIEELHKRLDSEEEHASELHSISDRAAAARRQFVEADRTVQLRLREMDDEQRLIDHITQQLQDAETVLDNLSTSDLHPQPLEQAVQDRNLLAVLLEQLHSIDLPAIRNAKNRTLLQERVAKVGERVQRLHDDLNDEVDEQTKIMEKLRDSLTRLNLIGDEISALPTDELDRHIAQMNTIQERLEDLIPTARIVDSAIDRPAKYILRPPVDRPLVERIVELQSILRERHEAATQLVQLKTVTPAINSVNDVLDTMLGQLEQAPVESLESQQAILEDLENNQRRLEQTLSELPPGKEADALRERSQWNLSRLKDWLKRLADAVGDRLAALAAFNATRDHVTRQVADLYNQNTSDASNESDIEGRIQQLLKLRTTLANATSDQLDTNSLKEAEILQQKIDEAIEQFQTALSNAKRLREEAILQAQFAANVKQAHDQLERLILAAQQQLADAEAIPNAYATLADDLTQELSATRYFLESAPADDSAVSELRTRLTLGDQLQQQLAQRWQLWQQFVHERDSANSRLDAVHSKLNKLMTKSREPLVDVRNSVDQLKLYGDDVEQLRTSMHNLQNLSEQLDPLESAYADVRFFDVGVEQTQQQYDDLLSGIAAEVRDEEHIQNAFVQLQAEIESVEDTMQAHDDASALDHALNYILPPLEAQFALLSDMHDAAVRNRKFVDRDRINTIAGEKLHNIRSQIESQLVHIAEQEKREQLQKIGVQIAELQASSGVSTEPQWTLLEQQLEQLPTDDVDAMRLRDQLSRARQNQQDHELLYANLKNELSALQRHTDDVDANIRPYLEEVHTSKSGKKKKTKPAEKSFDIDQQIIDIRRALDDLQNHAMPQLGDLQRKADLNNVILDAAAPLQDRLSRLIDEYQASLSQKETTRDRSKEIETQLHEVQDMLPGLQHVARTAETLPIETSVAETELEQTDVALQKLNDMLTRLDRLPTDGVQEGQLNELSKQKQQVNSAIERVRAWRDALIRQLEALRQWHDDQTKCQSDATQICRQAQQLCDRYSQGPQPLQVGMDDLKAAQNLQTAIWDQQKVLQAVMDRVCGQLPDPRKQAEEVERLKGEMNESSTNLKTLTNALEKAVQQEEELLQQQTFAIDRLNALSGEVMNMHSIEGNTPQQLQDLRAQTEPIQGIVQQLEHDAARSPSLVFHSEHLNALAVRAQLDNLVALLNEKQEDATARLMLAAQVTTIAENKTMLQDALKSAAAIEKDENATLESVNFALEILEKDGRPHLSVIEQTYSQLTSAPEADAVRAQALSDMTNLGENLKTLQLQLDDRYAGMRAFDEKCGALENLLTETEILTSADLQERSQLEKAQLALDSIQPLMAQIEVNAVELQPMRMPTQKVADFQARQARLGVKMQDARQKIESDERLQAAVRDAEDLLARIDDQLLPIESLLADASSSREDLVHVCQDRLPTADRLIEELHKRLDSEEEHASELHSISDRAAAARRQFVEADRTVQLRLREMDDEQRLIDHITQQLQDAETVLDNLSTSDLHPQPLEQAVQDRNLLAVLLEQLHSIDLPAIRNAKNRTLLQERVAKVGERVQRLHDDLNDEVDEQTKIMEKLRDSLTRLNLIGDEISALPTDELDRHIAQMNTIQERLEDLIPTARIVDSAIDRPAKYILRPPVDRPLVERIVELQSILRERHEAATQLVQLKTVTPAINSVNDVLDTMLGQLEQAPVESLESQQAILEDLENNQRRLEQTLSELPPGKEADALRERSQWNLSRLKDWLKRLADAVGDRLAALAAFNATRDHVTRQVADLYNQNTSDASNESDIEGRIQQLLKLRTTLANATSDQLDTNSLKEAEILQQKIDEAIEQFQTALSNAKRLREEAILQAQFAANVKQAHDQLERLILAAQQQLADAEAIPNAYATLADDLTQELSATRYFLESAPADDSAVSELRTRLTLGDQLQQQLAQRWQLWQQFVHERDSANSRLDTLRQLSLVINSKALRSLAEVERDFNSLKELLDILSNEMRVDQELSRSKSILAEDLLKITCRCKALEDNPEAEKIYELKEISAILSDIKSHTKLLSEDIRQSDANRMHLIRNDEINTDGLFAVIAQLEESLRYQITTVIQTMASIGSLPEYDIDAAAEVLAAVYPDQDPIDILQQYGVIRPDDPFSAEDSALGIDVDIMDDVDALLSPIPDDPTQPPPPEEFLRQRSRWRRILRTALPLQAMLVLLLGAACLVPHCDDEYCCQLLNNFARSLEPTLDFVGGPPPF